MPGQLQERAQRVQDDIGWADSTNAMEMGSAVLNLARLVQDLAREIDQLKAAQ